MTSKSSILFATLLAGSAHAAPAPQDWEVRFVARAGVETRFEVTDPAHPMFGFAFHAPLGALREDREISASSAPAPASDGASFAATTNVRCGAPGQPCRFALPVAVTLPYPVAPGDPNDYSGAEVLLFDRDTARYAEPQAPEQGVERRPRLTILASSLDDN